MAAQGFKWLLTPKVWCDGCMDQYLKQQVLSSGSYLLYQKQFKMNNE